MTILKAVLTKSLSLSSSVLAFVSTLLPAVPTATVCNLLAVTAATIVAAPVTARFDSLTGVGGF